MRRGYTETAKRFAQENQQGPPQGLVDGEGLNSPYSFLYEWWTLMHPLLEGITPSTKPDPGLFSELATAVEDSRRRCDEAQRQAGNGDAGPSGAIAGTASLDNTRDLFVSPELLQLNRLDDHRLQSIGPLPHHLRTPPRWNWPTASGDKGTMVQWPDLATPGGISPTTPTGAMPGVAGGNGGTSTSPASATARKRVRAQKPKGSDEAVAAMGTAASMMMAASGGPHVPSEDKIDIPAAPPTTPHIDTPAKKARGGKAKSPATAKKVTIKPVAAVATAAVLSTDEATDSTALPKATAKRKAAPKRKSKNASQDSATDDITAAAIAAAIATSSLTSLDTNDGRATGLIVPSQVSPLQSQGGEQISRPVTGSASTALSSYAWPQGGDTTLLRLQNEGPWKAAEQQQQQQGEHAYEDQQGRRPTPSSYISGHGQQRPPPQQPPPIFGFPPPQLPPGVSAGPVNLTMPNPPPPRDSLQWKDCPPMSSMPLPVAAPALAPAPIHMPGAASSYAHLSHLPGRGPPAAVNNINRVMPGTGASMFDPLHPSLAGMPMRWPEQMQPHPQPQPPAQQQQQQQAPTSQFSQDVDLSNVLSQFRPELFAQMATAAAEAAAATAAAGDSSRGLPHHNHHHQQMGMSTSQHQHLFAPCFQPDTQGGDSNEVGLDEETERLVDACVAEFCAERNAAASAASTTTGLDHPQRIDGSYEQIAPHDANDNGNASSDTAHEASQAHHAQEDAVASMTLPTQLPGMPATAPSSLLRGSFSSMFSLPSSASSSHPSATATAPMFGLGGNLFPPSRPPSLHSGSAGHGGGPGSEASSASASQAALRDKVQRSMTAQYEALEMFTELYAPRGSGSSGGGGGVGDAEEQVSGQDKDGSAGGTAELVPPSTATAQRAAAAGEVTADHMQLDHAVSAAPRQGEEAPPDAAPGNAIAADPASNLAAAAAHQVGGLATSPLDRLLDGSS